MTGDTQKLCRPCERLAAKPIIRRDVTYSTKLFTHCPRCYLRDNCSPAAFFTMKRDICTDEYLREDIARNERLIASRRR